jgi:hypothetical protein
MIGLMDSLQNNNNENHNKLLSKLYNLKLNFKNQNIIDEINNCNKIKKIIKHVNDKKLLIEKISVLNKLCISVFFNYGVSDNPNEGKPYIININIAKLPFSKNYYFDKRYTREISGYNDYCLDVLTHLTQHYRSVFGYLDVQRIKNNVIKFINMISIIKIYFYRLF